MPTKLIALSIFIRGTCLNCFYVATPLASDHYFHVIYPLTDSGDDFTGVALSGNVQSTGDQFCLTVSIVDDNNVESSEEFSVSLSLPGSNINPRIIVAQSEVTVTILDNEGILNHKDSAWSHF